VIYTPKPSLIYVLLFGGIEKELLACGSSSSSAGEKKGGRTGGKG